jgi:ABC-type polysaccharide/polyol phosphate export permease
MHGAAGAIIKSNPMTVIIEAYRSVLLYGTAPDAAAFGAVAVVSLVLLPLIWITFHRSEFQFAENI